MILRRADLSVAARAPAATLVAVFSPDGHRIVTGGEDGTLVVWSAEARLGTAPPPPPSAPPATAAPAAPPPRESASSRVTGLEPGEVIGLYAGELPGAEPDGIEAILVLDGMTGRPLEGASVGVYDEPGRGFGAAPFATAQTDEHGLACVSSSGSYQWIVRHGGRAPRSLLTKSPGPMTALFPAPGVRGRVADPFGRPLPGADVQWFFGCGHSPVVHRATTDAAGRFEFLDGDPRSGGMLWITGPGIASEYVDADILWAAGLREPVIATLPGAHLRGTVTTPDGRPCPGWPVWSGQSYRGPIAFTAADGSFDLPSFDPAHQVTLEEPGGRMVGTVHVSMSAGPARRRFIAPVGVEDVAEIEERFAVPWPVRVIDPADGQPLASGRVRIVSPESGAVYTEALGDELVEGANAILRAPEGRYQLTVGDAFASHVAGPVAVEVQRDARTPFVVEAAAQPQLDVTWDGPRPEASLRLVVPGAGMDVTRMGDDSVQLPREGPAALQVWVERGGLNSSARVMRVFAVGPEHDGRRTARVSWAPPRRVRLTGLGEASHVTLQCEPVKVESRREGDALLFETYAEGTLRVVVRADEKVAAADLDLDGPPGTELSQPLQFAPGPVGALDLRLPPDAFVEPPDADWETWVPGEGFGPSWSSSSSAIPAGGVVPLNGDETWPQLVRLAVEGWVPRSIALHGPMGRTDVRWGDAELVLEVSGPGEPHPDVVVWIEGVLARGEDGRITLRGVAAGPQRILVGAPGHRPVKMELQIAQGSRRSLAIELPVR